MRSNMSSGKVLLAAGILILLLLTTSSATLYSVRSVRAQPSPPVWVQVKPTSHPLADVASMAYDSSRQRSVVYNGEGETWEYDGATWVKKNISTSPPRSYGISLGTKLIYDSARKRIVLFGGSTADHKDLNETWEYDGTNWTHKVTASSPPSRGDFGMAYDSARGVTVLFGGSDKDHLGGTWEYDGANWTQRNTAKAPPSLEGPAMTFDNARKVVVLFGGRTDTSNGWVVPTDTWEYDGVNWIQKSTAKSPLGRLGPQMAYDSDRGRIVMFGGRSEQPDANGIVTLNDTWEYDGSIWAQTSTNSSDAASPLPRSRYRSGFAYDSSRHRIVMFGGVLIEEGQALGLKFAQPNSLSRSTARSPQAALASRLASPVYGAPFPLADTWEYSTQGGSPRLEITKVEFNPNPPRTFQQVDIKLTIENKGTAAYLPVWLYSGRVTLPGGGSTREIDFDEGHDSVLLLDNPSDPFRVNQKWVLTIHTSFWDAVSNGRMQITLQPKGLGSSTPPLPTLQTSQTVSVIEDLSPFVKCSTAIAKTFAGALGPIGKCVLHQYISDINAVQCKGSLCQAKAYAAGLVKCAVKPASIVAGIKATFDSKELESRAKDCFTPLQWAGDLIRDLIGRGININFFGIHSPATLLITDQSGRRTGMLDNGGIVQEIPDSWVVIDGEEKYVVYQGTTPVTVRVKGTGTGTMKVEMTTSDGKDGGRSVTYNAVPVNPKLVAQVVSTDGQAALSIDSNGDGQVDQSKKPDTMSAVAPVGYTFPDTGKVVSGKFWTAWQGGRSYEDSLFINGLPLTDRRPETNLTDGKTYETQWFERARFEYHPENQAPNDVLLGLMGSRVAQARLGEGAFKQVPDPGSGLAWFKETGHTLGDASEGGQAIDLFWRRLGGLAQFGFPLSQPFMETNKENGKQYLVQYFERQRFEYHPENKGTRFEVLLGRLGAEQIGGK